MRRKREPIEIQEPPLEEIKKKRSCIKRSCTSGCGCLFILLVSALLMLKFAVQPNIVRLKQTPENFPNIIPVYDADAIQSIAFVNGNDRGNALAFVRYVPKAILAPLVALLRIELPSEPPGRTGDRMESVSSFFQTDLADHRDVVTIVWRGMLAEPDFVVQFYETELKNHAFDIKTRADSDMIKRFEFVHETQDIAGNFSLLNNAETRGTDEAVLVVYY